MERNRSLPQLRFANSFPDICAVFAFHSAWQFSPVQIMGFNAEKSKRILLKYNLFWSKFKIEAYAKTDFALDEALTPKLLPGKRGFAQSSAIRQLQSGAACDRFFLLCLQYRFWLAGRALIQIREKSVMNYLKILILISFFMLPVNASAEFYKYVDENGNVRFTDDINQVPEAQRSRINSYVESESEELGAAEEIQAEPEEAMQFEQQANFSDLSEDETESLEDVRNRLDEMKKEIDREYEALKKAKEQLAQEKDQAKTRTQIIDFNRKVDELNKRVEAYAEKGKAYEAQVDAYNQRLMQQNKQKANQTP